MISKTPRRAWYDASSFLRSTFMRVLPNHTLDSGL